MIKAHKSTEAYAEQMSVLIDCRVALLKLKHTMELLRGSTSRADPREACLDGMADYLAALSDEYADQYCDLNDRERYDRAVVRHHINELAATNTDFDADEVPINQTWQLMRDTCPRLKDLIDGGEDYTKKFRLPLQLSHPALVVRTPSKSAEQSLRRRLRSRLRINVEGCAECSGRSDGRGSGGRRDRVAVSTALTRGPDQAGFTTAKPPASSTMRILRGPLPGNAVTPSGFIGGATPGLFNVVKRDIEYVHARMKCRPRCRARTARDQRSTGPL